MDKITIYLLEEKQAKRKGGHISGNGRVGRLIMFRECLCHDVVPFIIDERHKQFYYRGLREFASTPGYLLDTCLLAQDIYVAWVKYFYSGLFD